MSYRFFNKSSIFDTFNCTEFSKKINIIDVGASDGIASKFFMKKLLNNGIIVRSMEEYKIKNCLRLSIGNSSENKYLLKVVKKILKNV